MISPVLLWLEKHFKFSIIYKYSLRCGILFTNIEILLGLKSDYSDTLSNKEINILSDKAEAKYSKGKTFSSDEILDKIKKWGEK